jgi:hypothetical protein
MFKLTVVANHSAGMLTVVAGIAVMLFSRRPRVEAEIASEKAA